MRYNPPCVCGRSSSGRARPCQGRGSEFEPRRPLQKEKPLLRSGFSFCNFVGADGPVRPNTAQRCHSEPVTDVTGVGIRNPRLASLCEGGVMAFGHDGGRDMPRQRRGIKLKRGAEHPFFRKIKEGPPPGGPSFMQFLQRFSTSRTPRQYPYRRRCTGWPGPSWPRAASASRAAG